MSVEEPVGEPHKSVAICYVLLVLAGFFMAHRWYLRRRRSAALYIVLVWGGTILGSAFAGQGYVIGGVTAVAAEAIGWGWLFVDLFLIPGMARTTLESAR